MTETSGQAVQSGPNHRHSGLFGIGGDTDMPTAPSGAHAKPLGMAPDSDRRGGNGGVVADSAACKVLATASPPKGGGVMLVAVGATAVVATVLAAVLRPALTSWLLQSASQWVVTTFASIRQMAKEQHLEGTHVGLVVMFVFWVARYDAGVPSRLQCAAIIFAGLTRPLTHTKRASICTITKNVSTTNTPAPLSPLRLHSRSVTAEGQASTTFRTCTLGYATSCWCASGARTGVPSRNRRRHLWATRSRS